MIQRFAPCVLALAASCAGSSEMREQAPIEVDPPAAEFESNDASELESESDFMFQAPEAPVWTGAFGETAVMLADVIHVEGPAGLIDHVVASSDDAFYERTVETTSEGLMQVVRRVGADVPEIRVQLDAWKIAAFDRVVILERVTDVPVTLVASGDVLWRNPNGWFAEGNRLEFTGEMGNSDPILPAGAVMAERPKVESVSPAETIGVAPADEASQAAEDASGDENDDEADAQPQNDASDDASDDGAEPSSQDD